MCIILHSTEQLSSMTFKYQGSCMSFPQSRSEPIEPCLPEAKRKARDERHVSCVCGVSGSRGKAEVQLRSTMPFRRCVLHHYCSRVSIETCSMSKKEHSVLQPVETRMQRVDELRKHCNWLASISDGSRQTERADGRRKRERRKQGSWL